MFTFYRILREVVEGFEMLRGFQVSVYSTAANRQIAEIADVLNPHLSVSIDGDFLRVKEFTGDRTINLVSNARVIPFETSVATRSRMRHLPTYRTYNFRAGLFSKQIRQSTITHIYDVQILINKIQAIYAAVDELWKIPGLPEIFEALYEDAGRISSQYRWRLRIVKLLATRESSNNSYNQIEGVLEVLKAFDATSYNTMTAAQLAKLLKIPMK